MIQGSSNNNSGFDKWYARVREELAEHGLDDSAVWRDFYSALEADAPAEKLSGPLQKLDEQGITVPLLLFALDNAMEPLGVRKGMSGISIVDVPLAVRVLSVFCRLCRSAEYFAMLRDLLLLFDSVSSPLAMFTNSGRTALANRATREALGKDDWDLQIGKFSFKEERFAGSEVVDRLIDSAQGSAVHIPSYEFTTDTWKSELAGRTFDLHAVPFRDTDGSINGFIVILNDTLHVSETEATKRFTRYVELLADVAQTVGAEADLEKSIQAVLQKLTRRSFDAVAFFLLEGEELVLHSWRGLPNEFVSRQTILELGDTAAGQAAERRRVIATYADKTLSDDVKMLQAQGFQSRFDVPVMFNKRTIGVLSLISKRHIALDDDLKHMMEAIASQIAVGLENHGLVVKLLREASHLELERDFTQDVINAMGNAVLAVKPGGSIQFYNERFYNLTRFSGEEVAGRNVETFISDKLEAFQNVKRESAQSGEPCFCECEWNRSDGGTFTGFTGICPYHGPDGDVSGYVVSIAGTFGAAPPGESPSAAELRTDSSQ
ncbi:MAG: GAF domain-containing protein [Planctomycetota bacterium]|nr:GAF domain-containing protein [Planctomycetota bacterium]